MVKNLSIVEIIKYLQSDEHSRCIIEGEKILEANHLLQCGVTEMSADTITIFALCLQSSAITGDPHTITGTLKKSPELKVVKFECSCLAGKGGTCKHISATLIYCARNDVDSLEKLSSTDLKCVWSQKKSRALEQYKPMPLQDYCCAKKPKWMKEKDPVSAEDLSFFREELISACPDSVLSRHRTLLAKHKDNDLVLKEQNREMNNDFTWNINQLLKEMMKEDVYTFTPTFASKSDEVFFDKNIAVSIEEAFDLCFKTAGQDSTFWLEERSKRITGSVCYGYYTYAHNKNPDWKKKLKTSDFQGNENTDYGQTTEKIAKIEFVKSQNYSLYELGLFVHPRLPWFGFSPDGIVKKNQKVSLLEVKCPIMGKQATATDIVKTLPYVKIVDGELVLKERHKYYGQVQLGLNLSGIENCYFIIFSSFDNTYVNINVPINKKFGKSMFEKLSPIYFAHILPELNSNRA